MHSDQQPTHKLARGFVGAEESTSCELFSIRRLHSVNASQVVQIATLLLDCVHGGASVSFMQSLSRERAEEFWHQVARDVEIGDRALLIAEDDGGICGTVQLILAQPDNQPHRADLAKMLVHSRARKRGLGKALLLAAENMGRDCGKTLLVLDAVTGGDAERLYAGAGWQRVGVIPNYALFPEGGLCGTTFFYRDLSMLSGSRPAV